MASDASQATSGSAALPSRPEATVPLHEKSKIEGCYCSKKLLHKNGKTACCFFRETGGKKRNLHRRSGANIPSHRYDGTRPESTGLSAGTEPSRVQPVRHNKTADKFFLQNQPVTACGINNNNFFLTVGHDERIRDGCGDASH